MQSFNSKNTDLVWSGRSTVFFLIISVFLCLYWMMLMLNSITEQWGHDWRSVVEMTVFLLIGLSLFYGNIVYFLTRFGRIQRSINLNYPSNNELDNHFFSSDVPHPTLKVLIPTYKEELRVIEMTIMSAALMEYPHKEIVLLIDDPVTYKNSDDETLLQNTINLPQKINEDFSFIHQIVKSGMSNFQKELHGGTIDLQKELLVLIEIYEQFLNWCEKHLDKFIAYDHAEHFYRNEILRSRCDLIRQNSTYLQSLHGKEDEDLSNIIQIYYRQVLGITNVSVKCFQRKKYENISHEPNKAMNLNSYIGLIGGTYRENYKTDGTCWLVSDSSGQIDIQPTDYIITLDADSLLLSDYAKRLIYFLEQPENAQVAVAQTPYNTFRCPFVNIERIAGATTDIQHLVHQGFQYFNASFWVGANALLRTKALNDIRDEDLERGHVIYRFIQDRTVIEDTESSIDMIDKGWSIYNYLENLAFSATPSDFGSLIIQRRRWANGGLIIFPKLVKYILFGKTAFLTRMKEGFIRTHYLISIALVNIGVVAMMLYPFSGNLNVMPLVIASLLYFTVYARDLILLGYKGVDLLRVYALNLLLIPINLAGVLKSIQQMYTKAKIPFGRTPKVSNRTVAGFMFIISEFGLLIYLLTGSYFSFMHGRYEHVIFSLVNGLFFLYACTYFIGWKIAYEDIVASFKITK